MPKNQPLTSERLREAHVDLSHGFDHLMRVADAGDARTCDQAWDGFWRTVEDHLAFEERELFPVLAAEGLQGKAHVQQLAAEHATIRRDLIDIGVSLQLHQDRTETIARFIEDMRLHAAREDEWLHPAADRMLRQRGSFGVRVGLLAGAATGSVVGAIGGPPAAVAGALIGGAVGAMAARAAQIGDDDRTLRDGELDAAIGVSSGHLGEAAPDAPKARIGAFSSVGGGGGADEDDGGA